MRLAACALSAVLLSGCSWLGMGGHSNGYGTASGAYGANCAPVQTASYGQYGQYSQSASYGGAYGHHAGGQAGCVGGSYGTAQGYGAGAYGQGMHGAAGYGQTAMYGQAGYGQSAYGPGAVGAGLTAQGIGGVYGANTVYSAGNATTLGAAAPYGVATYGSNVVGTQMTSGQYVQGAHVQNVVGAPIYVPQPYPAPYGVAQLRGVGAAMPFGFEVFGGTEFDVAGDLVSDKAEGPSDGGGGRAGAFDAISYSDAFSEGFNVGAETSYDISRNTTLLASAAFSKREGQVVDTGSFESGVYDPVTGAFTPDIGATARDLTGEFSDLEQYSIEGGVRQYVGQNVGFRPYVGATAGFAYNNDVTLTQTYVDDGTLFNEQEFIDSGWRPTAAGVVGAELAVGPRGAIGVETGLRWRDNLKANSGGDDRLSIPVKLRGRLAF